MKRHAVGMALAVLVVAIGGCGRSDGDKQGGAHDARANAAPEAKVLNVYNWSDYIAEGTVPAFEQRTGIKVAYDVFDSNELLEAKLLASGERLRRGGALAELPRPADPGRRIPTAGQGQDPEPGQPRPGDDAAHRPARPRQPIRRALPVGHHRHRLQHRQGQGRLRHHRRGQQLGPGVQAGEHRQAQGLRRHLARHPPRSSRPSCTTSAKTPTAPTRK